ncbi:Transporter [Arcticibacter svalbardensis MN12-7]|uniref:Transporter n=1 Tax=Arcticibacter svalbardensis MN12-7 TaxID=1150600 RepID=R9GNT2_9SPHI|nr:permease [Arcticibacter svalbardensis]EOR93371.1 Transporter [Arcticibacter svalbardensis MN12-7]
MFDWLQDFADWLIYAVLGISAQSHLGEALDFFVLDTIKIFILLIFITLFMGIINSYFPIEKVRDFLTKRKWYGLDYFVASLFGTVTPFCSCSSVPLFIGFVKGGIPLGVTLAFLISSPLVDAVTVAMFIGMFGWKTTLIYVVSGIILSMIAGFVLGKMKLESLMTDWVKELLKNKQIADKEQDETHLSFIQRFPAIIKDSLGIVKGVSLYIVGGIAIGGLMHGFIPTGFFEAYISKENPFAVPLAVIIGVPMYSNTAAILPIMQVLVAKGIPLGTAIAFSMAVVGLSIPEGLLLKKVMSTKMLLIFFAVVTICIIISGYLFNIIL